MCAVSLKHFLLLQQEKSSVFVMPAFSYVPEFPWTEVIRCMDSHTFFEKSKAEKRMESVFNCFTDAFFFPSFWWQNLQYTIVGEKSNPERENLTSQQCLITFQNLLSSLGKCPSCIHCLHVLPFLIILGHLWASGKVFPRVEVRVCTSLPRFSWWCWVNQEHWLVEK